MEVNNKNEKKLIKWGLKTNKTFDSTFKKITHTNTHTTSLPSYYTHENYNQYT